MANEDVVRFTVLVPGPECALSVPYDADAADRYLYALVKDPARRSFAIELDGVHVGNLGLKDTDLETRTAECFIELGDARARGRGVALRAMTQLLDHAHFQLELVEVSLGVIEFNTSAIALYERLAFERTGHYADHWAHGRYWDVLGMQMTIERWAEVRDDVRRGRFVPARAE